MNYVTKSRNLFALLQNEQMHESDLICLSVGIISFEFDKLKGTKSKTLVYNNSIIIIFGYGLILLASRNLFHQNNKVDDKNKTE